MWKRLKRRPIAALALALTLALALALAAGMYFYWRQFVAAGGAQDTFYRTLDTEPAPVLSPAEAQAAFALAPGFKIELVAAEPLVEDPVAMAWDEYGRLYVVEMRGYMPNVHGDGSEEPVGQVVRLEDTDGDGRMDTSEVFMAALVSPRAVAVVNDGVLIGEPPTLWLCALPSREAVCADPRRVGDYAAGAVNVEHMENRLLPGLDNWLYNAKSARSLRVGGGQLAERQGFFRGQWGMAKDDYGRLFYNHNATWIQADLFAAEDLVDANANASANAAALGLGVNLTPSSEVFSVRVNPGVNRAHVPGTLREDGRLHLATGVSGLAVYRGDQFPARYRGDVFVPEVAGNVVAQFQLSEHGMELRARQRLYDDPAWGQRDFLASTDERFRPVDVANGPDGALYVIDMYRGIIQDVQFLTDALREQIIQRQLDRPVGMGRIWRIRHVDGEAYASSALSGADAKALLDALASRNGWRRDTAQRLLLARGRELREPLRALAEGDESLAAIHAIWTLAGRGELERPLTLRLARRDDPVRQLQALRAGRGQLRFEDVLGLAPVLAGAGEALQMQLHFMLGDHVERTAAREWLADSLAGGALRPYVRQAAVRALQGVEWEALWRLLATDQLSAPTADNRALFATLAANAYRSLRGDLSSEDTAPPILEHLLAMIEGRRGERVWQQIAMLEGLATLPNATGFRPARLQEPPSIFAARGVGASDPLWQARLAGRVAFTWPGDELAAGLRPLNQAQAQRMAAGKIFYQQCAACHGGDGQGSAGLGPPLAGSARVAGPPEWLARIILQGLSGPGVAAGGWAGAMPAHGHLPALDDATLAGLMTYMRRSWGHAADLVTEQAAASYRLASAGRQQPWTIPALEQVAVDRGFAKFAGKYAFSFLTMTLEARPGGLHLSVPLYGGSLLRQDSDTEFSVDAAGEQEQVRLEFLLSEDGSVDAFILHRGGTTITAQRQAE